MKKALNDLGANGGICGDNMRILKVVDGLLMYLALPGLISQLRIIAAQV
jgi:hypothetical protein